MHYSADTMEKSIHCGSEQDWRVDMSSVRDTIPESAFVGPVFISDEYCDPESARPSWLPYCGCAWRKFDLMWKQDDLKSSPDVSAHFTLLIHNPFSRSK